MLFLLGFLVVLRGIARAREVLETPPSASHTEP
jgi:hypothetical protein